MTILNGKILSPVVWVKDCIVCFVLPKINHLKKSDLVEIKKEYLCYREISSVIISFHLILNIVLVFIFLEKSIEITNFLKMIGQCILIVECYVVIRIAPTIKRYKDAKQI